MMLNSKQSFVKACEQRMKKCLVSMHDSLARIRTGRASETLISDIPVFYHGAKTPINHLASITVEDSHTLVVSPWEKSIIPEIEKALYKSNLGITPQSGSESVRVVLPALTQETREKLSKQASQVAESSRVSVRNIRRDVNNEVKALLKSKELSKDEERGIQTAIQKTTDQFIGKIEDSLKQKHSELKEI